MRCLLIGLQVLFKKKERQKSLTLNSNYIEWLYEFTKEHPKFSDTDWLYEKEPSMSENDYEKIYLLTDFFTAIDRYYVRNLLDVNREGYAIWYNIKYKEVYFSIGVCEGQGAFGFVTRYESLDEMLPETFIEFDDILHDKPALDFEQKQAKLQELEKLMTELKVMNTPQDRIQDVLDKTFESGK